jgi:hypothetical protein
MAALLAPGVSCAAALLHVQNSLGGVLACAEAAWVSLPISFTLLYTISFYGQ